MGTHTEAAVLEARKVYAGEVAATNPPVDVEDGARILAKTTGDVAGPVTTLGTMGGKTDPSASRTMLWMPRNRQMSSRSPLESKVQVPSFAGFVILFSTCFFFAYLICVTIVPKRL